MFRRSNLTTFLFFFIDISLTLLALRLAKILRTVIPLGVYLDEPLKFSPWLYIVVPLIWMVVFSTLKVYSPTRTLRYIEDLPSVWGAIIGAELIFAGVAYLLFRELSRFLFFYFFVLDFIFLSSWRWLLPRFSHLIRLLYRADQRSVLIVGAGAIGQRLAQAIDKHSLNHLTLIGFVDDTLQEGGNYPILGKLSDIPDLIQKYQLREIIFALPPVQQATVRSLVVALQATSVNLRLVPDVFDLVFLRATVEEYDGIPLIGLREPVFQGIDRLTKRLFDIIVSAALLIILSPLLLLIAVLIKLDSPGPILFRQKRVGERGRLFWMYKFRSMKAGSEKKEKQLLQNNQDGLPIFNKTPIDFRITHFGRFLRRTSLDELPQLFNVLKGEMSLVGPRPELPWMVEQYEPWQRKRFAVPQGMTGWWQVNGRMKRGDPEQRAEDDLFYMRNYSLWLDLRILWKTVQAVIHGEGAY